ncbi:MAG: hypothetical protein P8Y99_13700 [Calditrichaceae bacterium]
MKKEQQFLSVFIKISLFVLFYSLLILVIISTLHNIYQFISPSDYQFELMKNKNTIEQSGIKITIEKWRDIPYYLKSLILLRINFSGILYLFCGLIIVFLLRKLYKTDIIKENLIVLNALYINRIGLTLLFYSIIDFTVNFLTNIGITYNGYTSVSDNIHVGTRLIPSFEFEIFLFSFIIIVISDIYLRINTIEDDLRLTI